MLLPLNFQESDLTRDVNLAAGRLEGWLAVNDGTSGSSDRYDSRHSKIASQNRLQRELDRQSRIGAIDKEVR
jgi:hypothetical protein